jgi:plasmid segregation protein ParM
LGRGSQITDFKPENSQLFHNWEGDGMIVGMDCGRFKVKVWHSSGSFELYSNLGERRDLEFSDVTGKDDIVGEYHGRGFTGGTLAKRESEFGDSLMIESKLHEDTVILILCALHKACPSGQIQMVTGLPVADHAKQKDTFKKMLNGLHKIKINDQEKTFVISCEVVPEGCGIYRFAERGIIRGLNIGSRTVNAITFKDGDKIGRESDTFNFGSESGKSRDRYAMARAIAAKTGALKWKEGEKIFVFGGGAFEVYPHVSKFYPHAVLTNNPVFTDAEAFYLTAREIYA